MPPRPKAGDIRHEDPTIYRRTSRLITADVNGSATKNILDLVGRGNQLVCHSPGDRMEERQDVDLEDKDFQGEARRWDVVVSKEEPRDRHRCGEHITGPDPDDGLLKVRKLRSRVD